MISETVMLAQAQYIQSYHSDTVN